MVNTPLGQLRGSSVQSRTGRWYYAFPGVPFAEPPLRFQPSIAKQPWNEIIDARLPGPACPQMTDDGTYFGDENCLFLNISFPHYDRCQNESASGKLPVIFNIHDGAYSLGSGADVGMDYLMDECLVVVSTNYRLGALGFLTTDDGLIPGNLGLKDQLLALQWTQKYVSHFRGDPDSVTLMGISAGASSVSHHILSPASQGLFHRAISQSGTALSPWSISKKPRDYAQWLGQTLNCAIVDNSTSALKSCLESMDARDIVLGQGTTGLTVRMGPVIELASAENPFQTENPAQLLRQGRFSHVPYIVGFIEAEVTVYDPNEIDQLNRDWLTYAPILLQYEKYDIEENIRNEISTKIRNFYFQEGVAIGPETRQNLTNMYSDRTFLQLTFETVEFYSKFATVYPYVMTYKGGNSFQSQVSYEIPVIMHGDDGQYFFSRVYPPFVYGTDQYAFSQHLVKMWTLFAKTGSPGEHWQPTIGGHPANSQWHQLDIPEKTLTNYLDDRRTLWNSLGLYEYEFNYMP